MNLVLFLLQSFSNDLVLKLVYAGITLLFAFWTFKHFAWWSVIALRIITMVILICFGMPILFVIIANFIFSLIENFLNFLYAFTDSLDASGVVSFSENYKFIFFMDYYWMYIILLILEIVGAILFYKKGF